MKKKIDLESMGGEKDEHSYLMNVISAEIKKTVKDPFVNAFLNTQMINNFLFKWSISNLYDLINLNIKI